MQNKNTNLVLLVLCLANVLVPFMTSAINLALPFMNADLELNARMSSWIPTSYMLTTAILQIPCAKLADMYGRKRMFILGVALFTVFSVFCGMATSGIWLIVWRVMTGLGSAMLFGTSTAILTSSVSSDKRGWALGLITSVVYISLAAGPLLGGMLTTAFGWQSIFYSAAIAGTLVVVGSILFIKGEWKDEVKTKFDYVGTMLYAIGLFLLIYGFSQLPDWIGGILMLVGVVVIVIFGKHQQHRTNPIFDMNLFLQNKVFRLSNISALINYAATFAIAFMLSLYLQYVRGLTPRDAGLILIVQSVVQSIVSLQSGRLSDKMSASKLATIGMAMISGGLILLCFISEDTSYTYLIAVLALLGLGFGTFSSPNINVIMSSVEPAKYSMASATTGTMRLTGQAFSMGIAMMAISITIGNATLSPDLAVELIHSLKITFVICAVLCLLGVYTSSARMKSSK